MAVRIRVENMFDPVLSARLVDYINRICEAGSRFSRLNLPFPVRVHATPQDWQLRYLLVNLWFPRRDRAAIQASQLLSDPSFIPREQCLTSSPTCKLQNSTHHQTFQSFVAFSGNMSVSGRLH